MKNPIVPIFPIAIALVTGGCSSKPERATHAQEPAPVAVETATAGMVEWPSIYEAVGTVRARTSAQISSRVMAYVRTVHVQVGDRVREGQALAVLDSRDLEARERQAEAVLNEAKSAAAEAENAYRSAQANLELAEVTHRRMKDLWDKASISNQEYDEANARLKVARAALDMAASRRAQVTAKIAQADEELRAARIMRNYAEITSPFAGVVTEKTAEPGNLATPGAPLFTIEREGAYRLEASVEEANLAKVKLGQSVPVRVDSLEGAVTGRVSEIVPAVDPASRAFIVKIDLPGIRQLRSGMFGRARFETGRTTVVAIPANAISERGQIQWVYVIDGNVAHSRMVTVGEKRDGQVQVLSGLSAGERIASPVPPSLSDAARVEVKS
jgi:multidrug efflux system membrane fusion protein